MSPSLHNPAEHKPAPCHITLRTAVKASGLGIFCICISLVSGCYVSTNLDNSDPQYVPDEQSIAKGSDLYTAYCQDCHGSDLTGNGPKAADQTTKPANLKKESLHFTQTAIKGVLDYPHYSHETIEDKIKYGNQTMPALKDVLSSEEIELLTYYISHEIRMVE